MNTLTCTVPLIGNFTIRKKSLMLFASLVFSMVSVPTADLSESQGMREGRLWAAMWGKEPIDKRHLSPLPVQEEVHKRGFICCLRGNKKGERRLWPGQGRRRELWFNFSTLNGSVNTCISNSLIGKLHIPQTLHHDGRWIRDVPS